jgi:hypothetical protein
VSLEATDRPDQGVLGGAWSTLAHPGPGPDPLLTAVVVWLDGTDDPEGSGDSPCEDLGRARSQAGFTLREVLDDLDSSLGPLAEATGRSLPWRALYRRVTEGWVDDLLRAAVGFGSIDPVTGLPTLSFLRALLDQWVAQCRGAGPSAAPDHALVVARLPLPPAARHDRFAAQADAGRRLAGLGRPGEHVVSIGPGTFAALLLRDGGRPSSLPPLVEALPVPVELWVEPVGLDLDRLWGRLQAVADRRD